MSSDPAQRRYGFRGAYAAWLPIGALILAGALAVGSVWLDISRAERAGEPVGLAELAYLLIAFLVVAGCLVGLVPALVATFTRDRRVWLGCVWINTMGTTLLALWLIAVLVIDGLQAPDLIEPQPSWILNGLVLVVLLAPLIPAIRLSRPAASGRDGDVMR